MKRQPVRTAALALITMLAITVPSTAQTAGDLMGGDLGQTYSRGITSKFDQFEMEAMLADPAYLEQFFSPEMLEQFFDNIVVKVTFYPDGSYVAYAREGGEIVGLKLGKKSFDPADEGWKSDHWLLKAGTYQAPKRAIP